MAQTARTILHGDGNSRWFDKHQLVVCGNGRAGIVFEHAVGDGSTTLRLADEMHQFALKNCNYEFIAGTFLGR